MKSLIDFESAQPFATRFFTQALTSNHLVNAYILRGNDLHTAYQLILRLAEILNCTQKPDQTSACGQCQSCRWIEDNAHPGVVTVSNYTFQWELKEDGSTAPIKGKAHKSILVGQMGALLKELSLHSGGFHRVVILTGAQEAPASSEQPQGVLPPKDWTPVTEGHHLQLVSLDHKIFPAAPSNKFLKTLEEPPLDVMFFLLADYEEKLLETIVSRCQVVPLKTPASFYQTPLSLEARQTFEQLLGGIGHRDFMAQMHQFTQYRDDSGETSADLLHQFQQFVWEQITHPPIDPQRFIALKACIRQLEQAKTMLKDMVREEAVLEDLFLQLGQAATRRS